MKNIDLGRVSDNLNTLGNFLAKRDIDSLTKEALINKYGIEQADLLILFGGSIAYGCCAAGKAFKDGIAKQLMIVGGEGHTTPFLRRAISEKYPDIPTIDRSEADIIGDFLYEKYGLSKDHYFIENESANCGENASFSLKEAKKRGIKPGTVILMQDSSMQLRMDATYKKQWQEWDTEFINYAAYRSRVIVKGGQLAFEDDTIWGMWTMEHYITLVLGEIPRLLDTPEGYGPKGKDYIVHVDIPDEVLNAFENLKIHYGKYIRKPWQGK